MYRSLCLPWRMAPAWQACRSTLLGASACRCADTDIKPRALQYATGSNFHTRCGASDFARHFDGNAKLLPQRRCASILVPSIGEKERRHASGHIPVQDTEREAGALRTLAACSNVFDLCRQQLKALPNKSGPHVGVVSSTVQNTPANTSAREQPLPH